MMDRATRRFLRFIIFALVGALIFLAFAEGTRTTCATVPRARSTGRCVRTPISETAETHLNP